jgi:hypothetical protein
MVLKKKPIQELAASYVPANGVPKYVAGASPALSWTSIASEFGLKDVWKDLIEFNFPNVKQEKSFDDKCRAVNWMLETRVGCTKSNDGKNYSFEGASPGLIYVPKRTSPQGPKPKPPSPDYSLLSLFLLTDSQAARQLAPATIVPFPNVPEDYIRQRLAAAVRVARLVTRAMAVLTSDSNRGDLWNNGLEAVWFGDYSHEKFEKVFSTFSEIRFHLADPRLDVICRPRLGKFGKAFPGIRKITLGNDWIAPTFETRALDDAERVQTFIHEAAHIAGRVSASEWNHYGRDKAKTLADAGMRATRSADNYGYYAIDFALTPLSR